MSVFNGNIRALNLYAEYPKLHTIRIFYFMHAHVFCSYENSENYAQNGFLSLLDKCIFYQHATFGFGWLIRREGLKEKEPWFAASFPFLLHHHFQYKQWLVEGSHTGKRGYVWVHRLFVSPGTPLPFALKQILESKFSNGKPGPLGLSAPWRGPRECCAQEASWALPATMVYSNIARMLSACSTSHQTSYTKLKFKKKLRILRCWQ